MDMIDIVILDHEAGAVSIVKADPNVIETKYDNDIERYIEEFLEFKLSQVSWMSGNKIALEIFGGAPNGGLHIYHENYSEV